MSCIATQNDPIDARRLGGKAAALAELSATEFPVPAWFVVTPEAFDGKLDLNGIGSARVSDPVRRSIDEAIAQLKLFGQRLAVRSSGADEDSAGHSFAGQFDSFLFVAPNDVPDAVARVWQSGFSERVIAYRRERNLPPPQSVPAVLVQRMIDADCAGVAFSADPVSGRRDVALVSAVVGLGTQLVGGDADADTYHVDRSARVLKREIVRKSTAHRFDPHAREGLSSVDVPADRAAAPAITDAQAIAIAALARRAAAHFGRPQDIEWAMRDGEIFLLQSRPITSMSNLVDPGGEPAIWDNSNIAESYGGVTTPLTFSFARRAYEAVYIEFCELMGVPKRVIDDNHAMFGQMLGLIRGRVYYNLLNWYRLLAMLPGFASNRSFMEQMMGVREPLPMDMTERVLEASGSTGGLRDRLRLARTIIGLVFNHITLSRQIRNFYARLNDALREPQPPLTQLRLDELAAEFRALERQLLKRWDAPIVNDFFAMLFFGLLGKLVNTWCTPGGESLQNELVREGGGIISAEPAQRIRAMAALAASNADVIDQLCNGDARAAVRSLRGMPELNAAYDAYLDKFGDRCLEELKLESPTLADDPTALLRAIGHAAVRARDARATSSPDASNERRDAEALVRTRLASHPLRRRMFDYVLRHARARVRDRENLRFERTRLFGRVRRIFVEAGKRLHGDAVLADPRDIFYLEVDEILGFVDGTTSTATIGQLAALRKREFEVYRTSDPPDERFETRGAIHLANTFRAEKKDQAEAEFNGDLRGLGCCAGIVRGPVRVIRDPRGAQLRHGEILVAERTDPGWIMLFPAAAGILVERGSLLSHSAIVAREMGIPAIVSIAGLMQKLFDGQQVEMDGSKGIVKLLDVPAVEASR